MHISSFFKDTKPLPRLFGLFLLFLACFFFAVPLSLLPDIATPSDPDAVKRLGLIANGLSQLIVFLLPAWLFAMLFCGTPRDVLGLRVRGRQWFLAFVGMVTILLLIPVTDSLSAWNDSWTLGPLEKTLRQSAFEAKSAMLNMLSLTSPGDFLLQLLVMALLPAVCEEVFFRGALQPTIQSLVRNSHVGIFLTAVLFSLAHGDIYGFLPRLLLGLLLGYLFWTTGSQAVNICAHFVNNAVIVVAFRLHTLGILAADPFEPFGFPWPLTVGCTLGAILLFYTYFVKNTHSGSRNPYSAPA